MTIRVALNGWFLASPATGTGQYLRELAAAMRPLAAACGVEFSLISPQDLTPSPFPVREGVKDNLIPPSSLREGGVRSARPLLPGDLGKVEFEQLTFPRAAGRAGFNLLHVPYFAPPMFSSLPVVVTVHDLIPVVLPEYRGSVLVRLYTALAVAGARRANTLIADSQASKRDILARLRVPAERVHVIYLAANPRYRPITDAEEIARVRGKYSLPEKFVLYLGGFDVRKNVGVVAQAFSTLESEKAAGWRLVLAGRVPQGTSALSADVRRLSGPGTLFIGEVAEEDKPALYSAAAAFVYPSRYEGFGLPPLEAMSCGTPVLCANTSSLPEVVGEAGILLNPDSPQEWTGALRAVLNDEGTRKDLQARGLRRAGNFSWELTARETLQVYVEALHRNAI